MSRIDTVSMIITNARKIRTNDPQGYAWSGLRKYQNIELVTAELINLHSIPAKWHADARKQAQQIRYCIIQAREYFNAAKSVTLATKPNLLYYGTMSLALAEILFKQTGDSSLDKARDQHRHHGLTMTVGSSGRVIDLPSVASQLRATPVEITGNRRGTFHLWHKSAREHPIAGNIIRISSDGGSTTTFGPIFSAADKELDLIPANGLTLLECLTSIPSISDYINGIGIQSLCVRGVAEVRVQLGNEWRSTINLRLHPNPLGDSVLGKIFVDPNWVDRTQVTNILGGSQIFVHQDWVNGAAKMRLPQASMYSAEELRFMCNEEWLNEFGFLYVALFLAGNYARYFPDRWVSDVERSTPLAMAIEVLVETSEYRIPVLTLSELERTLFVLEA